MKIVNAVYFVHFPKLVVPPEGIEILGGRLEPFKFEDFEKVDRDWARQNYFEKTKPTVWRYTSGDDQSSANMRTVEESKPHFYEHDEEQGSDGMTLPSDQWWKRVDDWSMLIYYALLVTNSSLLPDPRLSARYAQLDGLVARRIGICERTFLLNGQMVPELERSELANAASIAKAWADSGLSPHSKVFAPLRCLALLGSEAVSPVLGVAPLVVSLEGYLLGRKVEGGIAVNLSRAIRGLVGNIEAETLGNDVRRIYAWRSDILHGRRITDDNLQMLFRRLCLLTRNVVRCATQLVMEQQGDGNDLTVVQNHSLPPNG